MRSPVGATRVATEHAPIGIVRLKRFVLPTKLEIELKLLNVKGRKEE